MGNGQSTVGFGRRGGRHGSRPAAEGRARGAWALALLAALVLCGWAAAESDCGRGERRCVPGAPFDYEQCSSNGHQWLRLSCAAGLLCVEGECLESTNDCPTPGQTRCSPDDGTTVEMCGAGGWVAQQSCPVRCELGYCISDCAPGQRRCSAGATTDVDECTAGGEWATQACPAQSHCVGNGTCAADELGCAAGQVRCSAGTPSGYETCSGTGVWVPALCASGQACQGGACVPTPQAEGCGAGERRCAAGMPSVYQRCTVDGIWLDGNCPQGEICAAGGQCAPGGAGCAPGSRRCDPARGDSAQVCAAGGAWGSVACPQGEVCVGAGVCQPAVGAEALAGVLAGGALGGAGACPNASQEVEDGRTVYEERYADGTYHTCTRTTYSRYCVVNGTLDGRWVGRRAESRCEAEGTARPCEYAPGGAVRNQMQRVGESCRACAAVAYVRTCDPASATPTAFEQMECGGWAGCAEAAEPDRAPPRGAPSAGPGAGAAAGGDTPLLWIGLGALVLAAGFFVWKSRN